MDKITARLQTWKDFDKEIDRAKEHLKENPILLWGKNRAYYYECEFIAIHRKGNPDIVCIFKNKETRNKKYISQLVDINRNTFKYGTYEGTKCMPDSWSELGDYDFNYFYFVTKIIDIYIPKEEIDFVSGVVSWNDGVRVRLKL